MNGVGYLNLLGKVVKDRVTGFSGVVTSISFDLYGCIQALVHPGIDKDKKILEQAWFDCNRLEVVNSEPVINQPDFVKESGPAEKPIIGKK